MTLTEYQASLTRLAERVRDRLGDAVFIPAAGAMLASIKNRIITQGQNSDGGQIGGYSITPAYYTRKQFVVKSAFKPQGKGGFSASKKQTRKSMYLKSGYSELRGIQGRENSFVNLEYSGDTFLAYQIAKGGNNNVLMGFTREKAMKIRQALEKRYGKVYSATPIELQAFNTEVAAQTEKLTRQILSA